MGPTANFFKNGQTMKVEGFTGAFLTFLQVPVLNGSVTYG